ncbi:hypothetical protein ACIBAH_33475 [Streptomyces sp. NPDC051445]|uniref:hypothetical protein n=1 Tax=unclassified Streptomyces TaxID=2593676 RepID=UPI0037AE2678
MTGGPFDRVHDTFVSRGIPVIIGEYALLAYDHFWSGASATYHVVRSGGVVTGTTA